MTSAAKEEGIMPPPRRVTASLAHVTGVAGQEETLGPIRPAMRS